MGWLEDGLKKMNFELEVREQKAELEKLREIEKKRIEIEKEEMSVRIPKTKVKLRHLVDWTRTDSELDSMKRVDNMMPSYSMHGVAGKIKDYISEKPGYQRLDYTVDEIMSYVNHSEFWILKEKKKEGVVTAYAYNEDIESVITYVNDQFVVTSLSSFKKLLDTIIYQQKRKENERT